MSAFFLTSCPALMVARLCLAAVAGLAPTGWSRAETFYFGYSGSPDGYVATTAQSIVVLGYIWRVGTFVSSRRCLTRPDDLRGARLFDGPDWYARLLNAAGGAAQVVPAAEIGTALVRGSGDGALFVIEVLVDGQVV